jgi:methyl-accepting chemotaxis protein
MTIKKNKAFGILAHIQRCRKLVTHLIAVEESIVKIYQGAFMFKNMKIAMKIPLTMFMIILVSILVIVGTQTFLTNKIVRSEAESKAEEMAARYANYVDAHMESSLTSARVMANIFSSTRYTKENLTLNRDQGVIMLREVLERNPEFLATWVLWEPNAFDGFDEKFKGTRKSDETGRYIPYIYRNGNEIEEEPLAGYTTPGEGDWYLNARNSGKEVVTEPYLYPVAGVETMLASNVVPILDPKTNKVLGVAGVDIAIGNLQGLVSSIKPYEIGWAELLSANGMFAAVENTELLGKNFFDFGDKEKRNKALKAYQNGETFTFTEYDETIKGNVIKVIVPFVIGSENQWAFSINIPESKILEEVNKMTMLAIFLGVIILIVATLIAIFMSNTIVTPIKQFVVMLKDISQGEGDLTQRVNIPGKDEINEMSVWFNKFIGNVQEIIRSIKNTTETVASASEELSAVSNQMLAGSEEMVAQSTSVAGATEQMSTNITTMASAAEEMSVNANEVAGAAEQTSQNMNAVSSAVEEMSVSIGQISQDAGTAREVADQASASSQKATTAMGTLSEAAKEIGNVTEVIKRIAEQTNLLALNATIEAASAGEAGKGFAVVANEIKELANQSAKAADDIATRIDGVQSNTNEAVSVISDVTEVIEKVGSSITNIAQAVEQQNAAVNDISANVTQAGNGVENIAGSISEVAKGANDVSRNSGEASKGATDVTTNISGIQKAATETSRGAGQVNTSATELSAMAADLQKIVGQFTI